MKEIDKLFPKVAIKRKEFPKLQRQIRVDDPEWQRWGEQAQARGMTRSEWIRMKCNGGK